MIKLNHVVFTIKIIAENDGKIREKKYRKNKQIRVIRFSEINGWNQQANAQVVAQVVQ